MRTDKIRPRKTVEVECSGPGWPCRQGRWLFWIDCLDQRLPDGPFVCPDCLGGGNHGGPVWGLFLDGELEPSVASLDRRAVVEHMDKVQRIDIRRERIHRYEIREVDEAPLRGVN